MTISREQFRALWERVSDLEVAVAVAVAFGNCEMVLMRDILKN